MTILKMKFYLSTIFPFYLLKSDFLIYIFNYNFLYLYEVKLFYYKNLQIIIKNIKNP